MAELNYGFENFWGMSEDDLLGAQGQVLFSEGMDLGSNANFINLAQKPKHLLTTTAEVVSGYVVDIKQFYFPVFCTDDQKIYKNNVEVWNGKRILNFWTNSKYLYMIDSSEDIHRILLSDTNNTNWNSYITTTETGLVSAPQQWFHIIETESFAYIAYETNLYVVANDTGQIYNFYNDFLYSDVVGFEDMGSAIKITQRNGKVLIWDKNSESSADDGTDLGLRVRHVKQLGGMSFIVSGESLYALTEFEPKPIFNQYYSDVLKGDKVAIARNRGPLTITRNRNLMYIAGRSKTKFDVGDGEYGKVGVMTYGAKKAQMPEQLNIENVVTSGEKKYDEVYGVLSADLGEANLAEIIYIFYKDEDGAYGIDYIEASEGNYECVKDGLIILNSFNGGTKQIDKYLTKLSVNADFRDSGGKLEFFKIDDGVVTPLCDQEGNLAEQLEASTISYDELDNPEISPHSKYCIYPKLENHDVTIAMRVSHPSTLRKDEAIRIFSITPYYEPKQ